MEEGVEQLINMVAKLKITITEGFEEVNKRLDKHDKRFKKIEEELDKHDKRFEKIEEKLDKHDKRFEKIEDILDRNTENQEKMIRSLRVFKVDIRRNAQHIDRLENKDDYLVSE